MSGDLRVTVHELEAVVARARGILSAVSERSQPGPIPDDLDQYARQLAEMIDDSDKYPFIAQLASLAQSAEADSVPSKKKKNPPHKKLILRGKRHVREIQSTCDRLQMRLDHIEESPARFQPAGAKEPGDRHEVSDTELRLAQAQLQRALDLTIIGIQNPALEKALTRLQGLLEPFRSRAADEYPKSASPRPVDILYESLREYSHSEASTSEGATPDPLVLRSTSLGLERELERLEEPRFQAILGSRVEKDRQIWDARIRIRAVRTQLKEARDGLEAEIALSANGKRSTEQASRWGIPAEACADLLGDPEWGGLRQLDNLLESLVNYCGSPDHAINQVRGKVNQAIDHIIRILARMKFPKPKDLVPIPEGAAPPVILQILKRARQTTQRMLQWEESGHPQAPSRRVMERLSGWFDECLAIVSLAPTAETQEEQGIGRVQAKLLEFEKRSTALVGKCLVMSQKLRLAGEFQSVPESGHSESRPPVTVGKMPGNQHQKLLTFGHAEKKLGELISRFDSHEESLKLACLKLSTFFETSAVATEPDLCRTAEQLLLTSRTNRYYQQMLKGVDVQISGQDASARLLDAADMESRLERLATQVERSVSAFDSMRQEIELALSVLEEALQPPGKLGQDLIPLCGSSPQQALAIIRWRKATAARRREAIQRLRQTGRQWVEDLKKHAPASADSNGRNQCSPPLPMEQLENMLSGMPADASVGEAYRILQNVNRHEALLAVEKAAQSELDFAACNRMGWAYLTQSVRRRPYNRGINELAKKAALSRLLAKYRIQLMRSISQGTQVGEFAWITPVEMPPLLKIVLRGRKD